MNSARIIRPHRWRPVAAAGVIALLASGCGARPAAQEGQAKDANGVVNMVMAPDPVWKWMESKGIKQELEEAAGIQILTSSSWDEFGVYAGGHADVVSAASYEVPDLEKQTGEKTTIFGKFNSDRSILAVSARSDAQTICDLKGKKIVTHSAVSITIMWGVYARKFCDLDLRAGGGDFQLVVTDPQNAAGLVERGDADAGLLLPDFSIPQLSNGAVKPLYDSKSVSQIYAEKFSSDPQDVTHPQNNVFVARKAWVEKNPEEAGFLIKLWDRGVQEWAQHRDEIVAAYPEDFAAESPEEKAFIQDWLTDTYDWFVDSTYLDQAWVDSETRLFELMKETGFVEEDTPALDFTILPKG
ncbi:ABC transporter substrate-binding protein [Plantactinospora mayteni]|uniref:Nitrate ABC transporter substrate-binding protein n=1 Tax=Plantactinospora mayteni TaxID=566021 RepID=A0ABQ4F1G5_9ACTN|nr:ABC transporter substrate-binding protein [Plantactinospora mayteni]GIH00754.1 nitrate ABC transporter substrate-binding protein [Plantactinospora mayteni]